MVSLPHYLSYAMTLKRKTSSLLTCSNSTKAWQTGSSAILICTVSHEQQPLSLPPHPYLAHLSPKLANPLYVYIYLLSYLATKIHSQSLDPQLQLLDKKQFRVLVPKG